MSESLRFKIRIAIMLLLFGLIGWRYFASQQGFGSKKPIAIPAVGIALNDTHDKVPGHPEIAIAQAKRLYHFIEIYRRRHRGMYPDGNSLTHDMAYHYDSYGFHGQDEAMMSMTNPYSRYSDFDFVRKNYTGFQIFTIFNKRPDGSYIGTKTPVGKKDMLADTVIYVHENIRYYKGDRTTSKPVGFYIALWKDGTVTRVPYDQLMYVPDALGKYHWAFQGQAGIPTGALTYAQFHKKYFGK